MTAVTIIGATGSLGRATAKILLEETDANLTLFSRCAHTIPDNPRVNKISASVFDKDQIEEAVSGSDVVFAALSGDLPRMAQAIIDAMTTTGSTRLIFITSYGIYGELPGQNGNVASVLAPYRQAADIIEASNLDYTILRPGWFDNSADRSYELVPKGEVITKNNVSRYAIADFVKSVANNPSLHIRENLGIVRD